MFIYVCVGVMYLLMRDGCLGRGSREWASGSELKMGRQKAKAKEEVGSEIK